MKRVLIAVDSSASFTKEEAKELGIAILPLTVVIEKDSYLDGIDIDTQAVYESIRQGKHVSSSQVNLGIIEEYYRKWDTQYDEILVFTISRQLSGTYSAMVVAAEQLGITKVHVIDSLSIGGIHQQVVRKAAEMVKQEATIEMIEAMVQEVASHSNSIIVPESLDQLKKSGRITPAVAMMASLLKIKPMLQYVSGSNTIDKYGIARSDKKVNEVFLEEVSKAGLPQDQLMIYLLHADNSSRIVEVEILMKKSYPNSSIKIIDFPPVLAVHAGMGCIAMQVCPK